MENASLCSIVIPVHNNSKTLDYLVEEMDTELIRNVSNWAIEYVFIDDGSRDDSWEVLKAIKNNHERVRLIKFTRNFGQVQAVIAGMQRSRGRVVINISADLQDPPELVRDIIKELEADEISVAIGRRRSRKDSIYRKVSSRWFYILQRKLIWPNMPDGGFDVVGLKRNVMQEILGRRDRNPFFQGMVLWPGYKIREVEYDRRQRAVGRSSWTLAKKSKYFIDGMLSYSYFPIRSMAVVGLSTFTLGIIYGAVLVVQYLHNDAPFKGWTPIMMLILVLSGLQMVMTSVLGEYMWRTYDNTKKRELYVIEEEL